MISFLRSTDVDPKSYPQMKIRLKNPILKSFYSRYCFVYQFFVEFTPNRKGSSSDVPKDSSESYMIIERFFFFYMAQKGGDLVKNPIF